MQPVLCEYLLLRLTVPLVPYWLLLLCPSALGQPDHKALSHAPASPQGTSRSTDPLSHTSLEVGKNPNLPLRYPPFFSPCFGINIHVWVLLILLLIFKDEIFGLKQKPIIRFRGTLKYLALEMENHVLKINISLTEGVHENLRRDPKVNNVTLLSLPFISWEQSSSKPSWMPEQKKGPRCWEMLALGRGLNFSLPSAIIIPVHKEEAKHRIQNLVAFIFF